MTNKAISIFNQLRPYSVGFDSVFDHFGRMFEDDMFDVSAVSYTHLTLPTILLV